MIGEELGTERLCFAFYDKDFREVNDAQKTECTKEMAGSLDIDYEELCSGRSEGEEPFPVTDNEILAAMKSLGEKHGLNVLAMRWQTTEYVQDSDGYDTDAQEWWAFAHVSGKNGAANISDVNNFSLCNETDWSPIVLEEYSGEGIVEQLSLKLSDALDCSDEIYGSIQDAMHNFFTSICGSPEDWINIDDAEDRTSD